MSSKLTQIELEEYREVFNDFDQDGSGMYLFFVLNLILKFDIKKDKQ